MRAGRARSGRCSTFRAVAQPALFLPASTAARGAPGTFLTASTALSAPGTRFLPLSSTLRLLGAAGGAEAGTGDQAGDAYAGQDLLQLIPVQTCTSFPGRSVGDDVRGNGGSYATR